MAIIPEKSRNFFGNDFGADGQTPPLPLGGVEGWCGMRFVQGMSLCEIVCFCCRDRLPAGYAELSCLSGYA